MSAIANARALTPTKRGRGRPRKISASDQHSALNTSCMPVKETCESCSTTGVKILRLGRLNVCAGCHRLMRGAACSSRRQSQHSSGPDASKNSLIDDETPDLNAKVAPGGCFFFLNESGRCIQLTDVLVLLPNVLPECTLESTSKSSIELSVISDNPAGATSFQEQEKSCEVNGDSNVEPSRVLSTIAHPPGNQLKTGK